MLNYRFLGWGMLALALTLGGVGCAEQDGQPSMYQAKSDRNARSSTNYRSTGAKSAWGEEREPTPAEVARMIEPNVLGISCLYDPFNPWIWDVDRTKIRGVKVGALYLLGPHSTGVFGDGTIRPRLTVIQRNLDGKVEHKLVKEWAFDVEQAMPFRCKKRSRWGWGYGLFLTWGDLDLRGKEIRLTVTFERADGLLITGTKKDFRVPANPEKG